MLIGGFRPLRLVRAAQAEWLQHLAQRPRTEAHQPVGGRIGREIEAGVDQRGRIEHRPRRADPGAVPARGAEIELAGEGRSGRGQIGEPAEPGLPQLPESRRPEDIDIGVDDLDAVRLRTGQLVEVADRLLALLVGRVDGRQIADQQRDDRHDRQCLDGRQDDHPEIVPGGFEAHRRERGAAEEERPQHRLDAGAVERERVAEADHAENHGQDHQQRDRGEQAEHALAAGFGADGADDRVEQRLREAEEDPVDEWRGAGRNHEGADGDAGGNDDDDDPGDDGEDVDQLILHTERIYPARPPIRRQPRLIGRSRG